MKFPAMLGNDLLEQAELIIGRSGVQIIKANTETSPPMAAINLINEVELDIGEDISKIGRHKIKELE